MRILVTGGAGFIGSHLCERLLRAGHEVLCLDNFFTGAKDNIRHLLGHNHFELIRHDIITPIEMEVDQIYNLACPASPVHYQFNPVRTIQANVLGVTNMLELAKRTRARILQASTSEVYGDPQVHPQPESYWGHVNPIGVRACYDEGKRVAETLMMDYHRQHGVQVRIARIFNSILASEWIMAFEDGETVLDSVEAFSKKLEEHKILHTRKILVPAFDPKTLKVELRPAAALIKHPRTSEQGFEVITRYGRRIQVTGDHSVFRRGRGGLPEAVPVRELKVGEYIAIAGRLPVIERDLEELDLIRPLTTPEADPQLLWEYALVSAELQDTIAINRREIQKILYRSGRYSPGKWQERRINNIYRKYLATQTLPLLVGVELHRAAKLTWPRSGRVRRHTGGGRDSLPARIPITSDFLWFLGLLMAEGTITRIGNKTYMVVLCSNTKNLSRAQEIIRSGLGLSAKVVPPEPTRGPALYVHSKLLCWLLSDVLGLGQKSAGKRIPGWVFQLPLSRLKHFLEGYREGDGTHSGTVMGKDLAFNTVSPGLALDLTHLLLRFGIVASFGRYETTYKEKYGDRRFPFYRVTICNISNFDVLSWDEGVEQRLNARRIGDLIWAKIKDIKEVEASPYVYDFCVPGFENFLAGGAVFAHNTFGPRAAINDGRVISNFVTQALRGEDLTVYGDGKQTRSFCYVDDMVDGLIRMMEHGDGAFTGPINLGNPSEVTILELAERIIAMTGSRSGTVFKPLPSDDPVQRRPDIALARQHLGWEPRVPIEIGLARTVEYFRDVLRKA